MLSKEQEEDENSSRSSSSSLSTPPYSSTGPTMDTSRKEDDHEDTGDVLGRFITNLKASLRGEEDDSSVTSDEYLQGLVQSMLTTSTTTGQHQQSSYSLGPNGFLLSSCCQLDFESAVIEWKWETGRTSLVVHVQLTSCTLTERRQRNNHSKTTNSSNVFGSTNGSLLRVDLTIDNLLIVWTTTLEAQWKAFVGNRCRGSSSLSKSSSSVTASSFLWSLSDWTTQSSSLSALSCPLIQSCQEVHIQKVRLLDGNNNNNHQSTNAATTTPTKQQPSTLLFCSGVVFKLEQVSQHQSRTVTAQRMHVGSGLVCSNLSLWWQPVDLQQKSVVGGVEQQQYSLTLVGTMKSFPIGNLCKIDMPSKIFRFIVQGNKATVQLNQCFVSFLDTADNNKQHQQRFDDPTKTVPVNEANTGVSSASQTIEPSVAVQLQAYLDCLLQIFGISSLSFASYETQVEGITLRGANGKGAPTAATTTEELEAKVLSFEKCNITIQNPIQLGIPFTIQADVTKVMESESSILQLHDLNVFGVLALTTAAPKTTSSSNQQQQEQQQLFVVIDSLDVSLKQIQFFSPPRALAFLQKVRSTTILDQSEQKVVVFETPFAQVSSIDCQYKTEKGLTSRLLSSVGGGKASRQNSNDDTDCSARAASTTVELEAFQGDCDTTLSNMLAVYLERFIKRLEAERNFLASTKDSLTDSIAASIGLSAVGVGLVATPIGVAAGCAALAAKDGVKRVVAEGKSTRGVSEQEGYKFGDFTRGVVSSIRKSAAKEEQPLDPHPHDSEKVDPTARAAAAASKEAAATGKDDSGYFAKNKLRFGNVAGCGAGALLGSVVAGPIGLVAGSVAGSKVAQSILTRQQQQQREPTTDEAIRSGHSEGDLLFEPVHEPGAKNSGDVPTPAAAAAEQTSCAADDDATPRSKLGSFARGVIARGKKAAGREESTEYRFGDFTRGLLSKK